jgi:cytochrome c-type biogenesis protein CcmE
MRMGLVERHRIERPSSTPMIRFTISDQGEALLVEHDTK